MLLDGGTASAERRLLLYSSSTTDSRSMAQRFWYAWLAWCVALSGCCDLHGLRPCCLGPKLCLPGCLCLFRPDGVGRHDEVKETGQVYHHPKFHPVPTQPVFWPRSVANEPTQADPTLEIRVPTPPEPEAVPVPAPKAQSAKKSDQVTLLPPAAAPSDDRSWAFPLRGTTPSEIPSRLADDPGVTNKRSVRR